MLKRKIFTLCFALTVILGSLSNIAYAKEPIYLLAASDFQAKGSSVPAENNEESAQYMSAILDQMESIGGYTTFNGLLFCGDYNQSYELVDASSGLAKIDNLVTTRYPECENRFYVQGNHDPSDTVGLSSSGANDTDDYGVYVIHEDDFPHNVVPTAALSATTATAENLKAYLKSKIEGDYKKPIFIISHLPLHFNSRTVSKNNAIYGNLLYDVIDDAAECGLNIVYLFGHNHSGGYDYYIGGDAIYLEPGDDIIIAQGNTTDIKTEKLDFIYLNAGYVGYTADKRSSKLTMTVFKIEDDKITTERYNMFGKYELKLQGTDVETVPGKTTINSKVYESPRTVNFKTSMAELSVDWDSLVDSGCYMDQNEVKGIARFIFAANLSRGGVKESGIVYLDSEGNEIAYSNTGDNSVFYSEITNIPLNGIEKCYAKAYCTVERNIFDDAGERTFWSNVVECDVDYSKLVTVTK